MPTALATAGLESCHRHSTLLATSDIRVSEIRHSGNAQPKALPSFSGLVLQRLRRGFSGKSKDYSLDAAGPYSQKLDPIQGDERPHLGQRPDLLFERWSVTADAQDIAKEPQNAKRIEC